MVNSCTSVYSCLASASVHQRKVTVNCYSDVLSDQNEICSSDGEMESVTESETESCIVSGRSVKKLSMIVIGRVCGRASGLSVHARISGVLSELRILMKSPVAQ